MVDGSTPCDFCVNGTGTNTTNGTNACLAEESACYVDDTCNGLIMAEDLDTAACTANTLCEAVLSCRADAAAAAEACDPKCSQCTEFADDTKCSECTAGNALSGTTCAACDSKCGNCTVAADATACTTCADGNFLTNTTCAACDSKCSVCTGAADT